jgi:hypothetical protein
LYLATIIILGGALAGCREGGPGGQESLAQPGAPVRVAVVPFDSTGVQQENAAQLITDEVVTNLIGTGLFQVVEPGIVYQALADLGTRNSYGLDLATMQKLQDKIGPVRAFVVGMVGEFDTVQVGPDSYPAISVSARVLDAQSGAILWSGSASRTGADSEQVFGLGAVHSPGRLARAVVTQLIASVPRDKLLALLKTTAPAAAPAGPAPAPVTGPTGKEKYLDESATYTDATLKALLVDVPGFTRDTVTYHQHHFGIVEGGYHNTSVITVRLVDCLQRQAALSLVQYYHPNDTQGQFAGLPAFETASGPKTPGGYHLDLAAGRFALFLTGPEAQKADLEIVAQALVNAMK